VNQRRTLRIIAILFFCFVPFAAQAAPKDAAAMSKIDEAINIHYLATEFDKAEGILLGVIKACGNECSPSVTARAWMYIGIVRGGGKQDLQGASAAFQSAKNLDPNVQLDAALATPEVQEKFDEVVGTGAAPEPATTESVPEAPVASQEGTCTPAESSEIQTRRPIPVSCTAPPSAIKGVLAFKEPGATEFTNLPMKLEQGTLRAPIPCSATNTAGVLHYYVALQNAAGTTVAAIGDPTNPMEFSIVQSTTQAPPAFPGSAPPARCAEEVECPPGMPGCTPSGGGGWGDSCTPAAPCQKGLYCAAGTCESAPSCDLDSDCDSGRCRDGFCDMGEAEGESATFPKVWFGIHFAPDLYFSPGEKSVCSAGNVTSGAYTCYVAGSTNQPLSEGLATGPDSGQIGSGFVLATMRVLLSADYALTSNVTMGGRLGFAFGGGPPSVEYVNGQPALSTKFLPIHAELRGAYWFKSLGEAGLHPYVHVGGGMAQVDAKKTNDLRVPQRDPDNPDQYLLDANGNVVTQVGKYDVYKKMGQGFATLGGGVVFPLGDRMGIQGNLNLMYMLPATGVVIEPSIGLVMGL